MKRDTGPEDLPSRVRVAVGAALRQLNLTHREVAERLGRSKSTIDNKLSSGIFSKRDAKIWSSTLGIPPEVFTHGLDPSGTEGYTELREAYHDLRRELDDLRSLVDEIDRRTR